MPSPRIETPPRNVPSRPVRASGEPHQSCVAGFARGSNQPTRIPSRGMQRQTWKRVKADRRTTPGRTQFSIILRGYPTPERTQLSIMDRTRRNAPERTQFSIKSRTLGQATRPAETPTPERTQFRSRAEILRGVGVFAAGVGGLTRSIGFGLLGPDGGNPRAGPGRLS
jgi:hypothetical protein